MSLQTPLAGAVETFVAKLLRFGLVGVMNGAVYALVTLAAVHGLVVAATTASLIGYLAVLPLAFLAHRRFTFRVAGVQARREWWRFAASYALGLAVSVAAMHIAAVWLGWPPLAGIAMAIALVPAVTFVLLERWVFAAPKRAVAAEGAIGAG